MALLEEAGALRFRDLGCCGVGSGPEAELVVAVEVVVIAGSVEDVAAAAASLAEARVALEDMRI